MIDPKRQSLVDAVERAKAQAEQAHVACEAADEHRIECETYHLACIHKLSDYDATEKEAGDPPRDVNFAIRMLAEQIRKLAEHPEIYEGLRTVMDYPATPVMCEGRVAGHVRNDPCTTTITIVTWPQRKKEKSK